MKTLRSRVVMFMVVMIVLGVMLQGCAALQSLGITEESYSKLTTPKAKMAFIYKSYNKAYDDYKVQAARTNRTEPENVILRNKKKVLTDVRPIIDGLDLALVEGKPFDPAIEKLITDSLRQLGTKIQ